MSKTSSNVQRSDFNSQTNLLNYVINQKMMTLNTAMLCLFDGYVTKGDTLYGEVTQLIDNVDSTGKPLQSPMQFDVPINYIMGGNAGINVTFKPKDLVYVLFSQQTLADLKQSWNNGQTVDKPIQPSNFGKFTLEDGIIIGKVSRKKPDIIIDINDDGITITSNNTPIVINSGTANTTLTCKDATVTASGNLNATCQQATVNATTSATITTPTLTVNGNLVVTGTITATDAILGGKDFLTHDHSAGTLTSPSGAVTGNTGAVA